jgi:hypothetical protein
LNNFTSTVIEELLAKTSYAPVARMDKTTLTAEQKAEVNEVEKVVSFGQEVISLFETMLHQLQTLPTQAQYVEAGLGYMVSYLQENKKYIPITDTIKEACKLRLTRTYMSKVIELHLDCIIAEELPHMTAKTFSMMDSVMGVDIVLEDDKKRYYVHVTSNTPFAEKMLKQKENRGGYKLGSTFISYSRDFTGDLILRYDLSESESTQMVNGFPLFNPEFVAWRFKMAKLSSNVGEDIKIKYSKLDHFKDWAKTNLRLTITSL